MQTPHRIRASCAAVLLTAVVAGCKSTGRDGQVPPSQGSALGKQESAAMTQLPLPATSPDSVVAAWRLGSLAQPAGYGLRVQGLTRSGKFTALVTLDADLTIRKVNVERYLGTRGGEIRQASFERQFEGKTPASSMTIGQDIDAVTGATISSNSMATAISTSIRWLQRHVQ